MARNVIDPRRKPAERNPKSAIYIRVSTVYQQDADSLPMQRKDLIAYSQLILGINDYVVFEDAGFSGKNTKRPGFQEMFDRIRNGEFTHLLVWKIDRISRNLLDFAEMYQELKTLKVTFISKNEQFDTSSAMGEAMLKIILVFAELERNMTSERVSATMLARAKEGKYNGSRPPFGYYYDKTDKLFHPQPGEAETVPLIYNLYEQLKSIPRVVGTLNTRGIPCRSAPKWSNAVVHNILHNPTYYGEMRYVIGSETVTFQANHEPLITKDQFERVQALTADNLKDPASHRPNIHVHPFSGLIYCGTCGHIMTAAPSRIAAKTQLRSSIFHCGTCAKTKTETYTYDNRFGPLVLQFLCNLIYAYRDFTDRTTLYDLRRRLHRGKAFQNVHIATQSVERLFTLLKAQAFSTALYEPLRSVSVADRESTLNRKRSSLDRLTSMYLRGEIPLDEYQKKSEALASEISNIEYLIKSMPGSADLDLPSLINAKSVNYTDLLKKIGPVKLRHFLHETVSRIYLTNGKISTLITKNGLLYDFEYSGE